MYNIMEMDKDGKTPEQKFSGVEFQIFPRDYHTWGCPIFFLESSLQGDSTRMHKWEPKASTGVYFGNPPFHTGSVALLLNTRTGHIYPQLEWCQLKVNVSTTNVLCIIVMKFMNKSDERAYEMISLAWYYV